MNLICVGAGASGQLGGDAGDVISGDDGDDAGELLGSRWVNAENAGVGVRAAEECCMEEAWQLQVVKVKAIPNEEPMVLETPDRLTYVARRGTPPKALVKIITTVTSSPSTLRRKLPEKLGWNLSFGQNGNHARDRLTLLFAIRSMRYNRGQP